MLDIKKPIPRWQNLVESIVLIASLIISAWIIFHGSGIVPKPNMDQHFVETVNIQLRREGGHFVFQYPNLMHTGGITSSLIAGVYKILIPTTHTTLNWHFKIFAMAGHLISSLFLLRTVLPRHFPFRILAFLIIATSGFQLIEPSSDVLSATLVNLFFIAVLRRWPIALSALILATFGLCKVELTLSAIALSLLWWVWEWRKGTKRAFLTFILTAFFMAFYLAPSFVSTGSNLLTSDRSSTAFFSAYRDYMRLHQFQPTPPDPEEAGEAILKTVFRDAPTFKDVVIKHPDLYFDFLGVSAARSIPNIIKVLKFMIIPFLLVLSQIQKVKENHFILLGSIVLAACILLPSWLVIFLRMRYLAKALPLIITATTASSIELSDTRRIYLPLLWTCGIATILWQIFSLTPYQD